MGGRKTVNRLEIVANYTSSKEFIWLRERWNNVQPLPGGRGGSDFNAPENYPLKDEKFQVNGLVITRMNKKKSEFRRAPRP